MNDWTLLTIFSAFVSWSVVGFHSAILSNTRQVMSTVPAQYFKIKRGLATGIVYAGGGIGGAVLSFAINGLIQKAGIPWAFRTIGILTWATGLPAAWLVKERVPIRPSAFIEWYKLQTVQYSAYIIS
jgi:MFS family permease